MTESTFGQMAASLRGYLAEISTRAETGHGVTDLARLELPRVIAALRALLADHHPDADGRCPTCRTRLFTRAPAPCRAYLTMHLCLLSAEEERGEEPRRSYSRHLLT